MINKDTKETTQLTKQGLNIFLLQSLVNDQTSLTLPMLVKVFIQYTM